MNVNDSLDRKLSSIEEIVSQLPVQVIEKIKRRELESVDEFKVLIAQLVQANTQILLQSLEADHNSIESLKIFVQNLTLSTRLLQQTASSSKSNIQYLYEIQSWLSDEVLGLLLNSDIIQLLLKDMERASQDDPIENPPPNPPPPRFPRPRQFMQIPPPNPPPPPR